MPLDFSWQWWVSQAFAVIGLIFVIISNQQKTTLKLMIHRNIATLMIFIGLCFLGELSAIIMIGAGVIRNLVSLYFAIKPNTKKVYKIIACLLIIGLIIGLNIYFWENYYNLFSIFIGCLLVVTFMQERPNIIRILTVIVDIISIVYYILLISPINLVIEVVSLVAAVVGIIRLDIKKKTKITEK